MKSNRGVTLTSLVIYVIGLLVVVGLIETISGYFFKNINEITIKQNAEEQYSKFLSYLTKDVNSSSLIFVKAGKGIEDENYVIFKFSDGTEHQYIYKDNEIYYLNIENLNEKKIVLCNNVSISYSDVFTYLNGKLNIRFKVGKQKYATSLNVNIGN